MYTIEKSKEYERQRKEENEKMKIGRGGEENGKERDGAGNFLNEIEKTALTSITVHDRIAARKVNDRYRLLLLLLLLLSICHDVTCV